MNATIVANHATAQASYRPQPAAASLRSVIRLAARDFAPFAVALIPFSLAIGTASAINGLSLAQAAFGAIFLVAGTAQLAASELLGDNTSAAVIVATIVLVNARFMVYGAGLARWFGDAPLRDRLLLAFPLVDQSFLCCEERFESMHNVSDRRRYYLAGTSMLLTVFFSSELIGYLVGPNVPAWLGLHLAAPLAFAGMLIKALTSRRALTAALAAACTVVVCAGLPGGLGLPLAIGVGLAAGARIEASAT